MRTTAAATALYVLSLTGVLATPTPIAQPKANRVRQESPDAQSTACGDIINEVNNGFAYFYATDAYACLTSVPFNAAVATRFINYVNTTLQFQSTLAYLESPPEGYQQLAINVPVQLEKIQANVTTGVYKNQYEFEADLQHLLYETHDAHLYLTAGISAAFSFQAPFSVTAASSDGKSLPQVYITADVLKDWRNENWTPSPIKTINNQTAVEYLTKVAQLNSFGGLEAHTDWNQLFSMPTLTINGDASIWDGYINFFPGDEIELTVANGTEYLDYWLALYNEPYQTGPLSTGGDFYNYFVLGFLPASYNSTGDFFNAAYAPSEDLTPTNETTPVVHSWKNITNGAYPDPDMYQEGLGDVADAVVSGYFLRDIDAAVLSIPSFGQTGYSIGNFSGAVSQFISNVTTENITRVVIDLQQNTGGTVELAFSTFKRFFPDADPFAGSRRRVHPLADVLGEAYTNYFDALTTDDPRYTEFLANEWVVTPRINAVTGQNFTSWAEYRGPLTLKDDTFSLTERYNLSSYDFAAALFGGWIPLGYAAEAPFSSDYSQPFETEKIVVLTDGLCSSTCALLVEMFTRVGVKTIVAGGAPTKGPMQAVGGTRGAAVWSADALDTQINYLSLEGPAVPQLTATGYRDSGVYTTVFGINLRDQMRPNETDPLQFKYEAADCRIFYTLDNVYNMSRLWRDAVAASFDDRTLCVEGSTGYTNGSKPAPLPQNTARPVLPFDFSEPDDVLIDSGLSPQGGVIAEGEATISNQISLCNGAGCNELGSRCQPVRLPVCNNPSAQYETVLRCIPYKIGQDYCPLGTTWQKGKPQNIKQSTNSLKPTKGQLSTSTTTKSVGPCLPNNQFNTGAFCSQCTSFGGCT
ncbi:hypothetical protein ACN47E_004582 [Coniothyrium glycines]